LRSSSFSNVIVNAELDENDNLHFLILTNQYFYLKNDGTFLDSIDIATPNQSGIKSAMYLRDSREIWVGRTKPWSCISYLTKFTIRQDQIVKITTITHEEPWEIEALTIIPYGREPHDHYGHLELMVFLFINLRE